ncbi:MAG: choice-of-anchor B family protein [Planctomycetota bacterium]
MTLLRTSILAVSLSLLPSTLLVGSAEAAPHEDDPKVLDRRPAIPGSGFRRGDAGGLASLDQRALAGGAGGAFVGQGLRLESWLTLADLGSEGATGNDCWGYASPSGREYALIGTSTLTAVVEVTDPANAQLIGTIAGPNSLWRDIKVYQDRAYAVSEGGSGIQVINLSNVDAGQVTLETTITGQGSDATHNVAIDEDSGFLYRTGGSGNGLRIYSLANPGSPQFVGSWSSRYVHDAQVVTYSSGPFAGRQVAFCCAGFNNGSVDTGLTILDVTNKSNIQVLSQLAYPQRRYSHQGWLSADRTRFYLGDELDEGAGLDLTTTRVFDVSDPANAFLIGRFDNGVSAISHNMYERDGYLFQANYTSGVRVLDIGANPDDPEEVAFFDTAPDLKSLTFNGLWSVYPNLPSGTVIGSDLERGLFVFSFDPLRVTAQAAGLDAIDAAGEMVTATIEEMSAGTLDASSIELVFDAGFGPVRTPMTPNGTVSQYEASFPALPCGAEVTWYVTAKTLSGVETTFPAGAPAIPYSSLVGEAVAVVRDDDMQSPAGWVGGAPGDTALRGQWELAVPIGTDAEPIGDFSEDGNRCWFTGQGAVQNNSDADVDFGFTTLTTPVFDLSSLSFPRVEYYRWYSNQLGPNLADDVFVVDISNDGGATWTNLETIGPFGSGTEPGWQRVSFLVAETLPPTDAVQLRFIATDVGRTNIVEAAIDEFRILDAACDEPVGTAYCTATPNSSGAPGAVVGSGSDFLSLNDLELTATSLPPSQTGFFIVSREQSFVAGIGGGDGNLCIGANIGRYLGQVANSGAAGEIRLVVDATAIPQPTATVGTLPGDTWNFQCWHRDANPGPTSNLTNGYSVTFR